ncbi:hypothetical protein B0H14DRAFT_3856919 [Mycena olivaceomarginata]|nr:hypothetical protein B0H14DRAFT_3856919 [Mycena olivaceomarginata]
MFGPLLIEESAFNKSAADPYKYPMTQIPPTSQSASNRWPPCDSGDRFMDAPSDEDEEDETEAVEDQPDRAINMKLADHVELKDLASGPGAPAGAVPVAGPSTLPAASNDDNDNNDR